MSAPSGSPAFAPYVPGRVPSQSKQHHTAASSNANRNSCSSSLPSLVPSTSHAREALDGGNYVNPGPSQRATTTDLLQVIEQQRKDLLARTDSVNAIQRNFERLSEMYRGDRAELEKLREEVQRLRERDAAGESELKVYAAVRAELEFLLESHKELQETRRQEQQKFKSNANEAREQMEKQQRLITQLQGECEQLCRVSTEGEEKLRRVTSELKELTGEVVQFAREVRGRVNSMPVETLTHNHSQEMSSNERNMSDAGCTVRAALTDAWDSVDAVCVALRKAHVSMDQMAKRRIERHNVSLLNLMQQIETMVREAVSQEEAACRETIYARRQCSLQEIHEQNECLLRQRVQEELALTRGEVQERGKAHDSIVSNLERQVTDIKKCLQDAQAEYENLQQRHQTGVTTLSEIFQQQTLQLRGEMQELKTQHERELATQRRLHESKLQALREQHMLALQKLKESFVAEYETKESVWQGRLRKLNEKLTQCTEWMHTTRSEMKKVHAREKTTCDFLDASLVAANRAHGESFLRHEATAREGLMEFEEAQRLSLVRQASDACKAFSAAAEWKAETRRVASFNAVEKDEATRRFLILLDAWATAPVVECGRSLFEPRLQEERRLAVKAMCSSQHASLEAMRLQLRELRRGTLSVSQSLHDMRQEHSRLSSSTLELTRRLELSCAASTSFFSQQQRQQQEERGKTILTIRALMQKLMTVEEAAESAYSCGICLQVCRNPLTCVPCGHTFCEFCLLNHPRNRISTGNTAQYCPECGLATCNMVVRVRALETLSGNFSFRKKGTKELQRVLEALATQ
ncbi:hypothetical protein C3747_50g149 [Trypanosoma cruzi]|uniref:RING-type domain-containing protein n=2 Tax=Trypanosoma cruzi TaxID=5693 RepID=Q4DP57_TRYCC|nr:hypothetical protein, conserved [Trypanosoma cruzi]EAN94295.1 hypothetical protein, conserved [Trypanosoma cruzi]PWV12595.1 hypothetical protein C3747_50g149 [Trypanosoma cruzi]RNC48591.1 hypothetical protein TcCL_NonESM01441 [Trypanosoma cruzi]|eukprot:XP_816146.1 hypothetical protein [Trypanosoma cruzi strain CL Brener]